MRKRSQKCNQPNRKAAPKNKVVSLVPAAKKRFTLPKEETITDISFILIKEGKLSQEQEQKNSKSDEIYILKIKSHRSIPEHPDTRIIF